MTNKEKELVQEIVNYLFTFKELLKEDDFMIIHEIHENNLKYVTKSTMGKHTLAPHEKGMFR
jgi:hypothetical protein